MNTSALNRDRVVFEIHGRSMRRWSAPARPVLGGKIIVPVNELFYAPALSGVRSGLLRDFLFWSRRHSFGGHELSARAAQTIWRLGARV